MQSDTVSMWYSRNAEVEKNHNKCWLSCRLF